jgi:predicted transcriptional regulator
MRKGTPQPLLKRSLIITKDDKAWRAALGVKQENLPVVVLLDSAGKVLWTHEGLYDDEAVGELKRRLLDAR